MNNKMLMGLLIVLVGSFAVFGVVAASGVLSTETPDLVNVHPQEGAKNDKSDKGDKGGKGDDGDKGKRSSCRELPAHGELTEALQGVVTVGVTGSNGGLANDMWATVVNRHGQVCVVTFSGDDAGMQWPGSRVISAQKANTANAFSLPHDGGGIPGLALSTANLFSAVQPGGFLFGLQESNPVDTEIAYKGNSKNYGQHNDPMRGKKIGGVNVFGGGLALYNADGELVGGLGVSGDTSCTDHNVAWKVRHTLNLDNVIAGVGALGTDNIVNDVAVDAATGHTTSPSGWGHPECDAIATAIAADLPTDFPVGLEE